jgi:hypothetical protein
MTSEHILELLIEERDRLNAAVEALRGPAKLGLPPLNGSVASIMATLPSKLPVEKKKRHISAAGKRKMAEAQKKRWAAFHAGKK